MLDFPSTPNVGDTLTGPSGQEWEWDGVKWIAVAGGGGGGGGPWFPLMGVTDGSNAAPGEVGEYVISADGAAASNIGDFAPKSCADLTLTAGDWLVSGGVTMTVDATNASTVSYSYMYDLSPIVLLQFSKNSMTPNISANEANTFSFAPIRIVRSTGFTINLLHQVIIQGTGSGGVQSLGTIWAWRMR